MPQPKGPASHPSEGETVFSLANRRDSKLANVFGATARRPASSEVSE